MHVVIWSKPLCPYCVKAEYKAKIHESVDGWTYEVKKLDEDFTREELLAEFPNAKTFPQITVNGEAVGGWDEFSKIQGNELTEQKQQVLYG